MATELENRLRTILKEKLEKIKPSNIKEGVTILDVTGTYKAETIQGPKIFDSVEEMNNTAADIGDIALVHNNIQQPLTEFAGFSTLYFPKSFTLNTAHTLASATVISGTFDHINGNFGLRLSINNNRMSFILSALNKFTSESLDSLTLQYTSTDGLTYTRSDSYADTYNFNTEIVLNWKGKWHNIIGEIVQYTSINPTLIYKYYANIQDKTRGYWYNLEDLQITWSIDTNKITSASFNTITDIGIDSSKLVPIIEKYLTEYSDLSGSGCCFFLDKNRKLKMIVSSSGSNTTFSPVYDKSQGYVGIVNNVTSGDSIVWDIDIEAGTYSNSKSYTRITTESHSYFAIEDILTYPIYIPKNSGYLVPPSMIDSTSNISAIVNFNIPYQIIENKYLRIK